MQRCSSINEGFKYVFAPVYTKVRLRAYWHHNLSHSRLGYTLFLSSVNSKDNDVLAKKLYAFLKPS